MTEVTEISLPKIEARNPTPWLYAAVGFAVAAFLAILLGFAFVVNGDGLQAKVHRSQMLAPFGIALVAIVTFCTVVWRGLISAHQLAQQARQLEQQATQLQNQSEQLRHQAMQVQQQIRQNDANDEMNLAKLLQEAAKLIGDKEKDAQVLGGIVTLEILLTEPKRRFAIQAMNLLADFYVRAYSKPQLRTSKAAARTMLARGASEYNLQTTIIAEFESSDPDEFWEGLWGVRSQVYTGGIARNKTLKNIGERKVRFRQAKIEYCNIDRNIVFVGCRFRRCKFKGMSRNIYDSDASFNNCDFTSANFERIDEKDLTEDFFKAFTGCFYLSGQAPRHPTFKDWNRFLTELPEAPKWHNHWYFDQKPDLS